MFSRLPRALNAKGKCPPRRTSIQRSKGEEMSFRKVIGFYGFKGLPGRGGHTEGWVDPGPSEVRVAMFPEDVPYEDGRRQISKIPRWFCQGTLAVMRP